MLYRSTYCGPKYVFEPRKNIGPLNWVWDPQSPGARP